MKKILFLASLLFSQPVMYGSSKVAVAESAAVSESTRFAEPAFTESPQDLRAMVYEMAQWALECGEVTNEGTSNFEGKRYIHKSYGLGEILYNVPVGNKTDTFVKKGFEFMDLGINLELNGKIDSSDKITIVIDFGTSYSLTLGDFNSFPMDNFFGKRVSDIYAEVKEVYLQKCKRHIS